MNLFTTDHPSSCMFSTVVADDYCILVRISSDRKTIHMDGFEVKSVPLWVCSIPEEKSVWIMDEEIIRLDTETGQQSVVKTPEETLGYTSAYMDDKHIYIAGMNKKIFRYTPSSMSWEKIGDGETFKLPIKVLGETLGQRRARCRKTSMEHRETFPDLYGITRASEALYFFGVNGHISALVNNELTDVSIKDSKAFFTIGASDSKGDVYITYRAPGSGVFRGNYKTGFKEVFSADEKDYTLICVHDDNVYIGADLTSHGHGLFRLEDEKLVPVYTGCEQEPGPLIGLDAKDGVMWLADLDAFFRYDGSVWDRIPYELPA